jgi:AcrR family transcriptional regulator
MPRVSEAHLAARRQQILDAAQACFIRNGFHVTSMQDVIAEAGLSVGAVYRYFKSKNDIVEAIAQQYSDEIGATLDAITGDPGQSLADVLQASITLVHGNAEPGGTLRIAVQLWAEALRG